MASPCGVTRDDYGFLLGIEDIEGWSLERKRLDKLEKRDQRLIFWQMYLSQPSSLPISSLKSAIRDGIPSQYRGKTWQTLCGSRDLLLAHPGYYDTLLSQKKKSREICRHIEVDVPRTFPNNEFFQSEEGQRRLERVLNAYSWYDPSVGYISGMNYICATLLLFMTEEEAFWMMVTILQRLHPCYFTASYPTLLLSDLALFDSLLSFNLPELSYHLTQTLQVTSVMYATSWLATLFTHSSASPFSTGLSFETLLRVWDSFFYKTVAKAETEEGTGTKVMLKIALAILKTFETRLRNTQTFEEAIMILIDAGGDLHDADALLKIAFEEMKSEVIRDKEDVFCSWLEENKTKAKEKSQT